LAPAWTTQLAQARDFHIEVEIDQGFAGLGARFGGRQLGPRASWRWPAKAGKEAICRPIRLTGDDNVMTAHGRLGDSAARFGLEQEPCAPELVALDVGDLEFCESGMRVPIRRSMTERGPGGCDRYPARSPAL
jgi:hypothetical protein